MALENTISAGPRTLGGAMGTDAPPRQNSFDTLRLVGSLIVLVGHAFIITGASAPKVGQIPLHSFGVCIFFAVSGYLITQSWLSDSHPARYLRRRLLRIIPALAVTAFLTALVVGPVVSSESVQSYFSHRYVLAYAILNSAMVTVWSLPGVFETLPLRGQVNGSLWTLPIEFLLYLVVPVFVAGRRLSKFVAPVALILAAALVTFARDYYPAVFLFNFHGIDLGKGLALAPYFWVGSALRLLDLTEWSARTRTVARLICAGLIAIWLFAPGSGHALLALMVMPIALVVLEIGLSSRFRLAVLDRSGDLSYGTYLWAFPVQQAVFQWTGSGPMTNMALSLPVVLLLAALSWRLIERPALKFKPKRRRHPEEEKLPVAADMALQTP